MTMEYTVGDFVRMGFGFDNPNHAAAFLCAVLPFCWGWRVRPWLGGVRHTFAYAYHPDGQLARADYGGGRAEDFGWDGLALVRRGDERFVNEPHPGGGSPVISSRGVTYLNDALGTTVGAKRGARYSAAALTAFGEGGGRHAFFTGKPLVEGLGRAFLMRNYRADLAKWQTADPLGYPDGWNPLAYCGNRVTDAVDLWGCKVYATFSISNKKLVVYDWDTSKSLSVQAFSGMENFRSVEYQWLPNKGPIPLGEYYIVSPSEAHPSWFELWRNDGTLDDETFGPNGVRRGEFRLHEGNVSAGCITMVISDVAKEIIGMIGGTSYESKFIPMMLEIKKFYGVLKVVE